MEAFSASVVIPTLNEEAYLPLLLNSLMKISTSLDVIVVDGNSEDDTVRVVEEFRAAFPDAFSLRLIRSQKRGISLQRNMGAKQAKNEILIFCDADIVIPSTDSYTKLISEFREGQYAAAAPVLVPIEPGIRVKVVHKLLYCLQRILLVFNRPYFAGSFLMTTKSTFDKVGGFDTTVFLGEDVDYSLRAARFGPCGLINIRFPVSARRLIKYGYVGIFKEVPNIFRLFLTGRVIPENIYYPFGEFGGKTAHHVTNNRGQS